MKHVWVKHKRTGGEPFEVNEVYYKDHKLHLDLVDAPEVSSDLEEVAEDDVITLEEVREKLDEKGIKWHHNAKLDTLLKKLEE